MSNRKNIEMDLSKAWQSLNEANIIPIHGMNPNDGVGDIKNAEVVGKASTKEQIDMLVERLLQSPAIDALIMKYLREHLFSALYCFKDLIGLTNGKTRFDTEDDGYDLNQTVLKTLAQNQKLALLIDKHLQETDDENEHVDFIDTDTQFEPLLRQKILTLMRSPQFSELLPQAIENLLNRLKEEKEEADADADY